MNKEARKLSRLGIMGGTFDPIHYGHLVTAECARYEYKLDKVIFIPAGQPPHKPYFKRIDPWWRFEMTRLAVGTNPFFEVSSLEIERPGLSYTIDTVQEISRLFPGTQIYFITGADAVLKILAWKRVVQILSICQFIAATRPGYKLDEIWRRIRVLPQDLKNNIFYMEVPALAISSTDIRQRVREGRPIKYLLPEPVEEFITSNNIYHN